MADETAFATDIKLTLYASDDEVLKELHRRIIPWGLLKKAIRMVVILDKKGSTNLTEEIVDQLTGLVMEIFKDQCTVEELENGASTTDMFVVLKNIMARAVQVVNPTLPPPAGRRKRK